MNRKTRSLNVLTVLMLIGPAILTMPAAGSQEEQDYQTASGIESWSHNYDISEYPDGKYNFLVRGRDLAGNTAVAGPFNVFISADSDLPVVSVANPEDGIIITGNLNVVGSSLDDDGISEVLISVDGGEFVTCEGTEYWSRYLDLDVLAEGPHSLEVKAVDINGLEGLPVSVSFTVDKNKPLIVVESHESGEILSGTVTLEGTVRDFNGIEGLSFIEKESGIVSNVKVDYNRDRELYEFKHKIDTEDYRDGPHDLIYTSTDLAGTEGSSSFLFFADNNPPELKIISPKSREELNQKILLAGTVQDSVGVCNLYYTIDGIDQVIELIPGDPYWTAELDLSEYDYGGITLEIIAEDHAGNTAGEKVKIEHSLDSDKPWVQLSIPEEIGIGEAAVDIGVLTGDDDGVQEIEYLVDEGAPEQSVINGQAGEASVLSLSGLVPGKHSISVRARDINGLYGDEVKASFTVPKDPGDTPIEPVAEITIQQPEVVLTGDNDLEISGSAPRGPGEVSMEVRLKGHDQYVPVSEWQPVQIDRSGSFSHTIPSASLPDGWYCFEWRARSVSEKVEESGKVTTIQNSSSAMTAFVKDSQAPQLELFTPVADDAVNGKISICGKVSDAGTVTDVRLSTDGENFEQIAFGSYFSIAVDFSAIQAAQIESPAPFSPVLRLRTIDENGLSETYPIPITYDAQSDIPRAEIQFPLEDIVISDDFLLSGTALDDDGIMAVYYQLDEGEWRRSEGANAYTIPVSITGIEDGAHTVRVKCADYNSVESKIAERVLMISRSDPVAKITGPSPSEFVEGPAIISGTADDPNGIAEIYISIDNGTSYNLAEGAEEWSYKLDAGLLKDETHSVYVRAVDNAGAQSLYTSIINVDNSPPEITLDFPLPNSTAEGAILLSGRIQDNTGLTSPKVTLVPLDGDTETAGGLRKVLEEKPGRDLTEHFDLNSELDISALNTGWYNLTIETSDAAGNTAYETRNILLIEAEESEVLQIIHPLEGENAHVYTQVEGRVDLTAGIDSVVIIVDEKVVTTVPVKENGFFSALLDETRLGPGEHELVVQSDDSENPFSSDARRFLYTDNGPWVLFEGYESGDFLTERTFITGTTGYHLSGDSGSMEEAETSRRDRGSDTPALEKLEVSFDNGRTFALIEGDKILSKRKDGDWKIRIETPNYPDGYLPVVAKSTFADGSSATARVLLQVDKTLPSVTVEYPSEGSRFNTELEMAGFAEDMNGMESVSVLFREGDKNRYQVPSFVQGLYFDAHALGATYGEFGVGLTFFDDNVKLQGIIGAAPPGRFTGLVLGGKLLANVATVPYSYLFGPDWQNLSMAFALGANFSYFTMSEGSYSFTGEGVILGSVLGQWEFLRYTSPEMKAFRAYSLYAEGSLWFISSDVQAGLVPRLSFGARIGLF